MLKTSPYEVLDLEEKEFSAQEIKRAYRKKVRQNPPEQNKQKFMQISDAYTFLSNEEYFINSVNTDLFSIKPKETKDFAQIQIDLKPYLKSAFETPFKDIDD